MVVPTPPPLDRRSTKAYKRKHKQTHAIEKRDNRRDRRVIEASSSLWSAGDAAFAVVRATAHRNPERATSPTHTAGWRPLVRTAPRPHSRRPGCGCARSGSRWPSCRSRPAGCPAPPGGWRPPGPTCCPGRDPPIDRRRGRSVDLPGPTRRGCRHATPSPGLRHRRRVSSAAVRTRPRSTPAAGPGRRPPVAGSLLAREGHPSSPGSQRRSTPRVIPFRPRCHGRTTRLVARPAAKSSSTAATRCGPSPPIASVQRRTRIRSPPPASSGTRPTNRRSAPIRG